MAPGECEVETQENPSFTDLANRSARAKIPDDQIDMTEGKKK